MVAGAAAGRGEGVEVPAPRHAPPAHHAQRMRAPRPRVLAPAVRPARGHEDVVTVDNLPAHAAAKMEDGLAIRLPTP